MKLSSLAFASVCVVSALSFGSCSDANPTTPPTSLTPTPAPTPTPTPEPTPTPVGTCNLAPQPDCGARGCCKEGGQGQFDVEIRAAQAAVRESRPDFFKPNGSLKVDEVRYTNEVAEKLTELYGLCARGGDERNPPAGHSISGDEVAVKRDNGLSQNVDIILGATNTPSITGYFTCRPASF